MKPKILICDEIDDESVKELKKFADVEIGKENLNTEKIKIYDVIIVRSATKITKEIIEKAENLKIIARAGVGLDNIDVKFAQEKNIKVINAP
ncbi:MAG: phosphoglycerate dehydrogenase, partial [Candidatus Altarchaeaceae archaeon]